MKTYTVTNGDADTVINSERLLRNAEAARNQMEIERNDALQREATALAERDEMRRIAAIAIIILVLVISAGGVLLWLNLRGSEPPPPPPPPPRCEQPPPPLAPGPTTCPKPGPPPRLRTPSRDHMQRCGAPDCCWEYPWCRIHNRSKYDVASAGGIAALKVPVSIDSPPGTVSSGYSHNRLPVGRRDAATVLAAPASGLAAAAGDVMKRPLCCLRCGGIGRRHHATARSARATCSRAFRIKHKRGAKVAAAVKIIRFPRVASRIQGGHVAIC
jgi:hypothetical protein